MHADIRVTQQANRKVFIAFDRRNAQYDVPSAFDLKPCTSRIMDEQSVKLRKIGAQTIKQNWLDSLCAVRGKPKLRAE